MLPPAQTIDLGTATADAQLLNGAGLLRGWSFQESTNAAGAALKLWDGTNDDGPLLVAITLATNESTRDYPAGAGLAIRNGLYLEIVTGSVIGAVWVNPGTRYGPIELVEGVFVTLGGES